MSVSNHGFVAWEEHIVCPERGRREVHFFLKKAQGHSVLAVVGTEKSIRHMLYVVTGQFSVTYDTERLKWRSRWEVVEWLQSLISRPSSVLQVDDSVRAFGSTDMIQFEHLVPRKLKVHDSNIVWAGEAWICTKNLKHYPAFSKNGDSISVLSFVSILGDEQNQYVGYLEDMYEDKKGKKKVKVRWFYHHQEVKSVIPQLSFHFHPREILITPFVQVISAECIVGPATVLTPPHYERYKTVFSGNLSSSVYICSTQYKNNKFKRFTVTKLRGYCNQAILSSLDSPLVKCQKQEGGNSAPGNQNSHPTRIKLKVKLSTTQPQLPSNFKVDDKIELLCEDSGIRGCWFRCKVLKVSQKTLRVRYDDVEDADGTGKLEECVRAMKVAGPDKLGMRCPGRLTIRPRPPKVSTDCKFEIGAAIDVWWCDGWWEGVVIGIDISDNDDIKVFLPGDDRYVTIQKENARISRDWIGNNWVDIKGNPDILSDASIELDLPKPALSDDPKDGNAINVRKRPRDNNEEEPNERENADPRKKSVIVSDVKKQ